MKDYGRGSVFDIPVFVAGEVSSTFDAAWSLTETQTPPDWTSVIALSQTNGRGQLRRYWHSPPGNVHVSFFLPDAFGPLGTLAALAVGWCVTEALAREHIPAKLKWPNDILITDAAGREGKLGGLLLEERNGRLVAGLGLNLATAPDGRQLRAGSAVPAAALHSSEPPYLFWERLLPRMRTLYAAKIQPFGPEEIRNEIEGSLAWMGRNVYAEDAGVTGRILGIKPDGSLRLACGGAETLVISGSVAPVG